VNEADDRGLRFGWSGSRFIIEEEVRTGGLVGYRAVSLSIKELSLMVLAVNAGTPIPPRNTLRGDI